MRGLPSSDGRRSTSALTPRMVPLAVQATAAVLTALASAVGLYLFLVWLLDLPLRPSSDQIEQQ